MYQAQPRRRRPLMVLLVLVCLWPVDARAQIFGRGSRTEFISGLGIRTFASFFRADDLLQGGTRVTDPSGRRFTMRVSPVALVYGLRPRISLIAMFPIVRKQLTWRGPGGTERLGAGTGLGDATLLVKWRWLKRDRGRGSLQLALQGGLKVPTGGSRLRDRSGQLLPVPLQHGTGSWDPTADLIGSLVTPSGRWFLNASIGGLLTTPAHGIEQGDRFGYDLMVKRRVSPLRARDLFVLVELNGRWQGRSRADGVRRDTGGHTVYLSPGVQYLLRNNVVIEGGVQLPVVRRVRGTQLAPSVNALFGIRYIILP